MQATTSLTTRNNTYTPPKSSEKKGWPLLVTTIVSVAVFLFVTIGTFFGLMMLTRDPELAVSTAFLTGFLAAGTVFLLIPTKKSDGKSGNVYRSANRGDQLFQNLHRQQREAQETLDRAMREAQNSKIELRQTIDNDIKEANENKSTTKAEHLLKKAELKKAITEAKEDVEKARLIRNRMPSDTPTMQSLFVDMKLEECELELLKAENALKAEKSKHEVKMKSLDRLIELKTQLLSGIT